jgi:hypothetical protein
MFALTTTLETLVIFIASQPSPHIKTCLSASYPRRRANE